MSALRCEDFRALVARHLRPGKPGRELLPAGESVAWHTHLVECADCREFLAEEGRLDELLAAVPEPELPSALAARVRAALEPARRRQREEEHLDLLLDGLPEPIAPEGMSGRVLAGLRAERAPAKWTLLRGRGLALAAAVLALLLTIAGRALLFRESSTPEEVAYIRTELIDEDELIVYALENWELLMSDDIEVYMASLDPSERILLELEDLDELMEETEEDGR